MYSLNNNGLRVTVVLGAVVLVGMSLFLFQQLAGINAVVYFSTQVFRSAGITSDVAASALVGAANVAGKLSTSGVCFYLLSFQVLNSNMSFAFGSNPKRSSEQVLTETMPNCVS